MTHANSNVMNLRTVNWLELDTTERRALLQRPAVANDRVVQEEVRKIVRRVRSGGDAALRTLAKRFDGLTLTELAVAPEEFVAARAELTDRQRQAIERAADAIERFHRPQVPRDLAIETAPGVLCERVTRPLPRVGLYVPAGSAPLPSTALMLGVPARIAGCAQRVMCSPARENGRVDPAVLYAAELCRIDQVFRIGGAQAIAAMAYGTESVPRVDKIFGPGNAWVTVAKSQVSRDPAGAAQDMPAGPSEVLVVADSTAVPGFVAADLLSQAEHGRDSQVVLVTSEPGIVDAVVAAIREQTQELTRRDTVAAALKHALIIVVPDTPTAIAVANEYAPEHLILALGEPRAWLDRITAAGSVFLGHWAPESVGDYCSGTNHVLPTYGYARSYSSLGVVDFMRTMTVQELTEAGLREIGPTAIELAELEGLDAHAAAVARRLAQLDAGGRS